MKCKYLTAKIGIFPSLPVELSAPLMVTVAHAKAISCCVPFGIFLLVKMNQLAHRSAPMKRLPINTTACKPQPDLF